MSDGGRCHYCRKAPCACDTAPQPPPSGDILERCLFCDQKSTRRNWVDFLCPNCGQKAGEHEPFVLEARIAAIEASNGNAFVDGAKWWEWQKSNATMWQSDQQAAFEEAKRRGFVFKPFMETVLEGKIAALEAQLTESQARLAMAVEALESATARLGLPEDERSSVEFCQNCGDDGRDNIDTEEWEFDSRGDMLCRECGAHRALCGYRVDGVDDVLERLKLALTATAASVAQHTASVERRGAAKELRRIADPKNLFHVGVREWAEQRAAELEGA